MEGRDNYGEEDKDAWADPAPPSRGPASKPAERADAKLTTEEADIPMSVIRGRSKGKIIAVALVAIAGVAGAAGGFGYWQNQRARKETEAAFGELSQCLLGQAMTEPSDVILQYRKHQVVLMGRDAQDRSEGSEPWPERCAKPALKVVDASEDAGLESDDGTSLNAAANELAKALKEKRGLDNDMSALLRATWDEAHKAKIAPSSSSVAGPPTHKDAMLLDDIPDHAIVTKDYVALSHMRLPVNASEKPFFFFDQKDGGGPFTCSIEADHLACKHLPAAVAKLGHALSLLGAADPGVAPLYFAGNHGDAGIYRGDTGELVEKYESVGGWARADGAVIVLGIAEGKMVISFQKKAGDKVVRRVLEEELKPLFDPPVEYRNGYYNTQIAHGFLYVRQWKEESGWSLVALPLDENGRPKKPIPVGPLPGLIEHDSFGPGIHACRMSESQRVVRAHMSSEDAVAFLSDGSWSRPVNGSLPNVPLQCGDGRAVLSSDYALSICTSAGCDTKYVGNGKPPADLAPRKGANDRAILKDTVVGAWGAGLRGGIRVKRANATEYENAPDAVFFDDLVLDKKLGDVSTVTELEIVTSKDAAVLLMQTRKGMVAMRIDASGGVAPDTVKWQ